MNYGLRYENYYQIFRALNAGVQEEHKSSKPKYINRTTIET